MKEVGFSFRIEKPGIDESFPATIPSSKVPAYLAAKKAEFFRPTMQEEIVVTADTVVILGAAILNKPADRAEAISMLRSLSGKTHLVITGVCILSKEKEMTFDELTEVTFNALTEEEIEYYVDHYQPYDKAGAYGAQDSLPPSMNPCSVEEMNFLNSINKPDLIQNSFTSLHQRQLVLIHHINGSYFNVMGLPIHKVYQQLIRWV